MPLTVQDITSGRARLQSPYFYVQAAGSDGSDGSASGIHLRWDFFRNLGDTHLPKGNLASSSGPYPSAGGFHKEEDFVTVLRAPYVSPQPVLLDLRKHAPTIFESGSTRVWRFELIGPAAAPASVVIRFVNVTGYDSVRASVNPATNRIGFVQAYTGVIEVEVLNELCFAVTVGVQQVNATVPGQLRLETLSVVENLPGAALILTTRKTAIIDTETPSAFVSRPLVERVAQMDWNGLLVGQKVIAENIRYIRFDTTGCFPLFFELETYRHFIQQAAASDSWHVVRNDFAISLEDTEVFTRLESPSYLINQKWPKYLGANATTGLFTVNTQNYINRWSASQPGEEGVRFLVEQYLKLSSTPQNRTGRWVFHPQREPDNTFFQDTTDDYVFPPPPVPNELGEEVVDEGATSLDSLSMIKLLATDFHIARMLGLGHIDANLSDPNGSYIYLAIYETISALEPGQADTSVLHVSMSLPTTRQTYRLPAGLVLKDLIYGLSPIRGSNKKLTDEDGYIPNTALRIVNLHIDEPQLGEDFSEFYSSWAQVSTDNVTLPLLYGVKYGKLGDLGARVPELSNDSSYQDASGVNETVPIAAEPPVSALEKDIKLFVHQEEEAGIHFYAVYGINWFSRVLDIGNIRQTDETVFALADIATLLPPLNLGAQLIQSEDPLVFTSVDEQVMLQNLINSNPTGDHTLVRVTFDWNHAHNIAHQWADKVQFFFRQTPLRIVRGGVKEVNQVSETSVVVRTQAFSTFSQDEVQTYNGVVLEADKNRFIDSIWIAGERPYRVTNVETSAVPGEGSIFTLQKFTDTVATDVNNTDEFIITDEFFSPEVGERFSVTENMSEPGNWSDGIAGSGTPLTKEVTIIDFSSHQEQVTEYDGTITTVFIGGIVQTAEITALEDVDDQGLPIPGSKSGVYEVKFATYSLAPHPETDVDWYRGVARLPIVASTEKKVCSVIDIGTHGGTLLRILVVDPEGGQATDQLQTGLGISVNFHPGYRVYLKTQAPILTTASTLPLSGQRIKQTLFGARSLDMTINAASPVSTPSLLFGREIIIPVQPGIPSGAAFATRPDFYGKSTYTFETTLSTAGGRTPSSVVFYRLNEQSALEILYKPATVQGIKQALGSLPVNDAAFYFDRFRDLINVVVAGDGRFKEYVPGGYRFPNPDNDLYIVPNPNPASPPVKPFLNAPNPGTMVAAIVTAFESIAFPLTEQPVFFAGIRMGRKTSNRKPVIRDANGNFLLPTNPAYDPVPMAVVLPGTSTIRFTDYTLDGSSRNIYFYFVKELNDLFQFSASSQKVGPVRLINSFPPEAPGIKKVISQIDDPLAGTVTGVRIEINSFIESENIRKIQLYRALTLENSGSVRTMKLINTQSLTGSGPYVLVDEFTDLTFIPFADPLYYRVVALREIMNEDNQAEDVPSKPTQCLMASVIDVINPVAPSLMFEVGTDTGSEFREVKVKWTRAAYNGKHYLYKMTDTGNWFRIFETDSNDDNLEYLVPGVLPKVDVDGDRVYHRFKVDVENSSGLLNIDENAFVL
jgi:hypothetical protein